MEERKRQRSYADAVSKRFLVASNFGQEYGF
jgi:hypothetical protein